MEQPTMITPHWWTLILRGILAMIYGILIIALSAMALPAMALHSLISVIGAYAFADGILAIISALTHREHYRHWWWTLFQGANGVAAGILTVTFPDVIALTLLYVIAVWTVLTGVFELIASLRLREVVLNDWLLALSGIVSLAFGILIVIRSGEGTLAIMGIIAAYAVVFGILMVAGGLRLRTWMLLTSDTRTTGVV